MMRRCNRPSQDLKVINVVFYSSDIKMKMVINKDANENIIYREVKSLNDIKKNLKSIQSFDKNNDKVYLFATETSCGKFNGVPPYIELKLVD